MNSLKKPKNVVDPIVLVLHNIRSSYNVGSLFRTSDAVSVEQIIISGYTPTPIDRFGRDNKEIAKTSLGAEKTIKWEKVSNLNKSLKAFKEEGYLLVGLELDPKAVDYREIKKISKKKGIVLVLGNEVRGISKDLLKKMDYIAQIPMNGKKESLNVSVAGAVMLFSLR